MTYGQKSYIYNFPSWLIETSNQLSVSGYRYNRLGDKLQKTVDGQTTNYTLDLNASLTQALSDGTSEYVYGQGRIAQVNTTAEYFLGDALGSVRQLTDQSGAITLAQSYDPYGKVIASSGTSQTMYGFTSEQTDASGLVYLRARYYSPLDGRFMSRDTWEGNINSPLSLNRWNYVEGNPINATDPSGHITEKESKRAELILEKLDSIYDVKIKKDWGLLNEFIDTGNLYIDSSMNCTWMNGNWRSLHELELILQAVKDMTKILGPEKGKFNTAMRWKPVRVYRIPTETVFGYGALTTVGDVVIIPNNVFTTDSWAKGTTVHELSHVWDARQGSRLSTTMVSKTHSFKEVCYPAPKGRQRCEIVYDPTGEAAPTDYAQTNPKEDWAESFEIFVYPSMGNLPPLRRGYIEKVIKDFPYYP